MTRPRRLEGFSYIGLARYFLTFCTRNRRKVFFDEVIVSMTMLEFRQAANREEFAILAFCVMPDHSHLLVEGATDRSDLRRFVKSAKQQSGAAYALRHAEPLWQEGYYERVLRADEDLRGIARYILWNPVRAGLVRTPVEYPYIGSDVWSIEELIESR
jgi:REP element-mobilizing transposase RayT